MITLASYRSVKQLAHPLPIRQTVIRNAGWPLSHLSLRDFLAKVIIIQKMKKILSQDLYAMRSTIKRKMLPELLWKKKLYAKEATWETVCSDKSMGLSVVSLFWPPKQLHLFDHGTLTYPPDFHKRNKTPKSPSWTLKDLYLTSWKLLLKMETKFSNAKFAKIKKLQTKKTSLWMAKLLWRWWVKNICRRLIMSLGRVEACWWLISLNKSIIYLLCVLIVCRLVIRQRHLLVLTMKSMNTEEEF